MAVGKDIRFSADNVADRALGRKSAAINFGRDALDNDPPTPVTPLLRPWS
jgi:hypothetical protein